MKLLVDVNVALRWVEFFQILGLEALRGSDIGAINPPDSEVMAWAVTNGYAILTHEQDFNTILALSQRAKPSVVLLRTSSLRLETVGERVWQAIKAALPDLEAEAGCELVAEDERARARTLLTRAIYARFGWLVAEWWRTNPTEVIHVAGGDTAPWKGIPLLR